MTGQTWADGGIVDLKKGFTNIAAEYIQQTAGGDLFHIEQTRIYSKDHFKMIEEAKEEWQKGARPELKSFLDEEKFSGYDTVFLGFPNWWGTVPMPVLTFLEHYDWSGKKIIPFVTSGGSGFAKSLNDIKKSAKGAEILSNGLSVIGTQVEKSKTRIQEWAKKAVSI